MQKQICQKCGKPMPISSGTVGETFGGWGGGGGTHTPTEKHVGDKCSHQVDCGSDMYCGSDGTCQQGPSPYACGSNADCEPCHECQDNGACMYTGGNRCPGISDGSEGALCQHAQDCGAGLYCSGGKCQVGPAQGTCDKDSDCSTCEACFMGWCMWDGMSNGCSWDKGKMDPSQAAGQAADSGSNAGWWIAGGAVVLGVDGLLIFGSPK